MFIWVALKEKVKEARVLWIITEVYSNQGFLPGLQENCQKRYLHDPMIWKVMQRSAWRDIANLRIKQPVNCSKSRRHAWMIIKLNKKKWDQLENCQQFAHKLFWNVQTWLVLVDLKFMVREQTCPCGHKMDWSLWQNVQRVWSRTLITHLNSGNILMWETQHNIADEDCFKTLISQETLKTRSQHQEEFFAFSEVTRSYQ